MTPLVELFAKTRSENSAVFMPFLVVGDPSVEATLAFADALIAGGADAIEFGLAFSDPPADGPVIQAADVRALEGGITVDKALDAIAEVHRRHPSIPLTMLVYANLVFRRGIERFYADVARAGVCAVLVADVPLEAAAPFTAAAARHGVAPIFVVSELTRAERLEQLADVASGYIYVVARVGVTGERHEVAPSLAPLLQRIRAVTSVPLLVGFGIGTPEHVCAVIEAGADGAICGSAIVRRIEAAVHDVPLACEEIERFTRAMKHATHAATCAASGRSMDSPNP
jgi:tryptophan synthase alpha chain